MIVGGLFLAAALAGGGHCGGGASYGYAASYTYSASTYSAPYVAIQAKLIPVATEYYPSYGYGYGALVGSEIRAEVRQKEREEEREALLEELRSIRKVLAERPPPAPTPEIQAFASPQPRYAPPASPQIQAVPQAPAPLSVPEKSPQAMPPLQPISPPAKAPGYSPAPPPPRIPAGDEAAQVFSSILSNRCAGCHSQGDQQGGVALFSADGEPLDLSAGQLRKIDRAVSSGRMPKGAPLPAAEAQALEDAIVGMYRQARR